MYGKFISGTSKKGDKYGFVNENQIRIESGIALLGALYAFVSVVFFAQFTIPMVIVTVLILDFFLKIFISPQLSVFSSVSKIISKKEPLWIGSIQKRFAWSIGLFLSTFVFFCMLILSGLLDSFGILTELYKEIQTFPINTPMAISMNPAIIACLLCIIFMTLESLFGYCFGCKIYQKFVQWGVMKKINGQNCVGGVCEI